MTVKPRFFAKPSDFRAWLLERHGSATELWVGFRKRATGKPSITWPESVAEALCVGWIDGIRKRIDDENYMIRFTPRRPTGIWSAVNIKKMEELIREKRVLPAGLKAYECRTPERSAVYSFERAEPAVFDEEFEREFRTNAEAWAYFERQAPWYRRTATHWVIGAKKAETRVKRLRILIASSAANEPIPTLKRNEKKETSRSTRQPTDPKSRNGHKKARRTTKRREEG